MSKSEAKTGVKAITPAGEGWVKVEFHDAPDQHWQVQKAPKSEYRVSKVELSDESIQKVAKTILEAVTAVVQTANSVRISGESISKAIQEGKALESKMDEALASVREKIEAQGRIDRATSRFLASVCRAFGVSVRDVRAISADAAQIEIVLTDRYRNATGLISQAKVWDDTLRPMLQLLSVDLGYAPNSLIGAGVYLPDEQTKGRVSYSRRAGAVSLHDSHDFTLAGDSE